MQDSNRRSAGNGSSTRAALEALERGYQPIPIRDNDKKPYGAAWTQMRWQDPEQLVTSFDRWAEQGAGNVGLLLGEPSGGLVDVDLDHPKALRLRDYFLPPSAMATGRAGRSKSHRWYLVTEGLPKTRKYTMPDRSSAVELRSTGAQTVIPPSLHPSGETYRWEGAAWGGEHGPAVVDGKKLAIQVGLVALGTVLLDNWPRRGTRHEAYLALAGAVLRGPAGEVNPYWERNLGILIGGMADAMGDEEATSRIGEVLETTLERLRTKGKATGFPRLAEFIGNDHAELARRRVKDLSELVGQNSGTSTRRIKTVADLVESEALVSTLDPEVRAPMEERITSWSAVDLEPYLSGEVTMPEPSLMLRTDDHALMYPGRVNSLFGRSESAKSWVALYICIQEMAKGERVMYLDLEDSPEGTIGRLLALGAGADDITQQFCYVHPEGPLAQMQRYRYGPAPSEDGLTNAEEFAGLLRSYDPTLIVADGMTVLYGLHGHDTNETTATEVIGGWLKSMCRGGRTTVVVIDHTGKGGERGSSPIGSQHKVAFIQGTALQVHVVERPMPGKLGSVDLIVHKDRPGMVRAISSKATEQVAGVVSIDSRVEGITAIRIDPPDPDVATVGDSDGMERELASLAASLEVQNQILALLGDEEQVEELHEQGLEELHGLEEGYVLTGDLREALDVDAESYRKACTALVNAGLVGFIGDSRWRRFRLVERAT